MPDVSPEVREAVNGKWRVQQIFKEKELIPPFLKGGIGGIFGAASALALLAGCGTPQKEVDLIWPLPPDPPRIKYLYSISSEDDVKEESFTKKLKETVIGREGATRIGKPYAVHADKDGRILVA